MEHIIKRRKLIVCNFWLIHEEISCERRSGLVLKKYNIRENGLFIHLGRARSKGRQPEHLSRAACQRGGISMLQMLTR